MSTIERLAVALQALRNECEQECGPAEWEELDSASKVVAEAIAQAHAESAELENGISEIFAKHCDDFPDAATANNATKLYAIEGSLTGLSGACDDLHAIIAELERRNAELVEALRQCVTQLEIVLPSTGLVHDERSALIAAKAALAHGAQER